uniref:sperm-associated antigen 16 protein-like n=1 Tax=Centroberyx gerrardi TaxID=166262 RepID=UPI003AB0529D
MTTTSKKQEADSFYHEPVMIPADADDDFQYEEVAIEDDWSLTEGEEDLEATVRAIQDRAEASAPAAARLDSKPPASDQPEAVDDFLRNFLHKMDMANTLDCFQTEWNEMVQKGLINTERVGLVPAVYIQNQRLDSELKNAQRERKEYQLAASAAAETLLKVQKARDFHRLQHKRVVQEKNRLIEEMRKLKVHCASHEPAIKQMNEKYQTVLRQKMLVSLERDKALGQATRLQATAPPPSHIPSCIGTGEEGQSLKQDRGVRCERDNPSKEPAKISRHPKDSDANVPTKAKTASPTATHSREFLQPDEAY